MPDAPIGTADRIDSQVVEVPLGLGILRTFLRVLGPGYLVAVGYMDPGNWATDLAAGSQFGYRLLWVIGLPLLWGVGLTAADTLLLLALQHFGICRLEALVIALVALVGGCFAVEMLLLQPSWSQVGQGFIPQAASLRDGRQLFLAAGILGATVMPHNLYLHSSLVQSRLWIGGQGTQRRALAYSTWDTLVALSLAFLINVSILVLAAGSFYGRMPQPVTDLSEAYRLLTPMLGTSLASVLFGEQATNQLLVLSQVVLSLQLPFAVIPLVWFCGRRGLMGELQAPRWLLGLALACAALIVLINGSLLLALERLAFSFGS